MLRNYDSKILLKKFLVSLEGCISVSSSSSLLSVLGDYGFSELCFRENWVGSREAGMKTTFFVIFDPTWTHILVPKGPNKEFLKQHFSYERPNSCCYQFYDFNTD